VVTGERARALGFSPKANVYRAKKAYSDNRNPSDAPSPIRVSESEANGVHSDHSDSPIGNPSHISGAFWPPDPEGEGLSESSPSPPPAQDATPVPSAAEGPTSTPPPCVTCRAAPQSSGLAWCEGCLEALKQRPSLIEGLS